jgi:vacuolar protein sorting-associated protein 18
MEIQKKHGENKKINKVFLDLHGHHLFVCLETGETLYFGVRNPRAGKGRPVSRLGNIHIESIAWNPDATSATTRDILIGTQDGLLFETYLEISDYIPNARYLRQLRTYGSPIIGLHVEASGDSRQLLVATKAGRLTVYSGNIKKTNDIASIYVAFLEEASWGEFQPSSDSFFSAISILPQSGIDIRSGRTKAYFAFTMSSGLLHGNVNIPTSSGDDSIFADASLISYDKIFDPLSKGKPILIGLSQFHILVLHDNHLVAINRFNNGVVFKDNILPTVLTSLNQLITETR